MDILWIVAGVAIGSLPLTILAFALLAADAKTPPLEIDFEAIDDDLR